MKIDRLIAIIMTLLERDKVKADELAKMFEVSSRTIYRDLETINQAGIPVVAVTGPGNGISILKSYKIEKRLFSTNEITSLLMALGNIQSNLPSQEITTALAKVKGMIPSDKQQELNFKSHQVQIDLSPWLCSGDIQTRIELIQKAIESQSLLQFEYRDRGNQHSHRKIEPYRLLFKGEDWYIQGFCLMRQDFRIFKIFRMQNIEVLGESFQLRPFQEDTVQHPNFNDTNFMEVTLLVHESIIDKIISRFGEECLVPKGPNYYIASVHMPVSDHSANYLLGFGDKCECIEPACMRAQMFTLSQKICQMYSNVLNSK